MPLASTNKHLRVEPMTLWRQVQRSSKHAAGRSIQVTSASRTDGKFELSTYSGRMATSRQQQIPRGSRVASAPSKPPKDQLPEPEEVADPTRPRHVIDYTMQRRATLLGLVRGGLREDICDADPILLRTAKYHGEATTRDCPVCRRERLVCITYTFGAEMGELSGRVRTASELPELATQYGAFRVYVVEVCRGCEWNHLVLSYVLGDGRPRKLPRRGRA